MIILDPQKKLSVDHTRWVGEWGQREEEQGKYGPSSRGQYATHERVAVIDLLHVCRSFFCVDDDDEMI